MRETRRKWQPTPVLLPGKFHGKRCLVGLHGVARVGHDLATKQQCGKIISYIALLIYVHCNNSISENLITNLNSKEERQKEQGRTEGLWGSGFLF